MTDAAPLLDPAAPWPVPAGSLGRTRRSPAGGPGDAPPGEGWRYAHDAPLAAPPVVTRAGEAVLVDGDGRLVVVSREGDRGWTASLGVAPARAFNNPAVWRRDGRTLLSVSHEGGIVLVEPGAGTVEDVAVAPPSRFLTVRDDGRVFWSRKRFSLLDDRGAVLDELRFPWRTDDVAHPTVGGGGTVYCLENQELSMTWDAEDQFLGVVRVAFDGRARRDSVHWVHTFDAEASGALCATGEYLFWLLDGREFGHCRFGGGEPVEVDVAAFPPGHAPTRILGGAGDSVLLQRGDPGHPVYLLRTDGTVTEWPLDDRVDAAVVDGDDRVYVLAGGRLHGARLDGEVLWTRPAEGQWLTLAGDGRLLVAGPGGTVRCLSPGQ